MPPPMPLPMRPFRLLRRVAAASLALAVGLAAPGCDHATTPDGPNLTDRFGPFTILEGLAADRDAVDFAAGERVVFTARFNKQTAWVLEIEGQESGALHRIEGFSSELGAANAQWAGRTTELPLFNDEPVEARLFFPSEAGADTSRTGVTVLTPRAYPGAVVADFEGGDRIVVGNFEFEFEGAGISAEVPPGQGDGFYLLRGTDDVVRNFFVGLIEVLPRGGAAYHAVPTSVPDELYLNFFLHGFETPNTIAVVQVIADANGNGRFDDGVDTVFPFGDVRIDFAGWRAFAKSMRELGLTQQQAQQVVNVRVLLISDNNNQPTPPLQVDYGIDYLTFTAGGPLQL